MEKEFTATLFIFKENKLLMIKHKKFNKWLPPGGHVDPGELPHETALREAVEETGIEAELIPTDRLWIPDRPNAISIPAPYFMLEQKILPYKGRPEHCHIDSLYIGRPKNPNAEINTEEEHEVSWLTLEEILAFESDVEIFKDTQIIAEKLFKELERSSPFFPPFEEIETSLPRERVRSCPFVLSNQEA
jgi:8-oxo-dGTP pyrophosphatase MutT (NUDIX family)